MECKSYVIFCILGLSTSCSAGNRFHLYRSFSVHIYQLPIISVFSASIASALPLQSTAVAGSNTRASAPSLQQYQGSDDEKSDSDEESVDSPDSSVAQASFFIYLFYSLLKFANIVYLCGRLRHELSYESVFLLNMLLLAIERSQTRSGLLRCICPAAHFCAGRDPSARTCRQKFQ